MRPNPTHTPMIIFSSTVKVDPTFGFCSGGCTEPFVGSVPGSFVGTLDKGVVCGVSVHLKILFNKEKKNDIILY